MVESTFSEQAEIIDSFKVGPEPAETHRRLWNEEFLGKLRVLGEVENFQTKLLDNYATRPVRQENLKITKLNQESKNIMHKAERIQ